MADFNSRFLFFTVLSITHFFFLVSQTKAFTVDLIHRNSPLSPFYYPSETHSDRLRNAHLRSLHRFKPTASLNAGGESQLIYGGGEYFMNISIGSPPVVISGNADTGSDLTWTQCEPCISCFKQLTPIFVPKQSSTYSELPCESSTCKIRKANFCTGQNICGYNYSYSDGSFTNGIVATETIGIGSVAIPNIVFGCGFTNKGIYDERGSGIIGLGRGPLSFISQFKSSIGQKFSYCLVPNTIDNGVSKITFGSDGVVSGPGTVSTPLVANGTDSSYYYLRLDAISVGTKRMNYFESKAETGGENDGNIIIDSGTTYTFLLPNFYDNVRTAMVNAVQGLEEVKDPSRISDLCYKSKGDFDAPIVTFHFRNANVELKGTNTFIRMSDEVVCMTMIPRDDSIYGNLLQMNFLVGYDLDNQTVSFKPTDCTQQLVEVD